MKVVYSAAALRDLREIGQWIKADNPARAVSFIREIQSACGALLQAPRAYPKLQRFSDLGLRKRVFRNYLIIYRLGSDVEIYRVIHGARDYDASLSDEGGDA